MNKEASIKDNIYIPVKLKFQIAFLLSVIWVIFSVYLSQSWIKDLTEVTNVFTSLFIIGGIAYVPGFINCFLLISVLLDKQPVFKEEDPYEEVTILIAAYNEEDRIYETLSYIKKQDYNGKIRTLVINNNSSDNTRGEAERAGRELGLDVICIDEKTPGKFNALNTGLKEVKTPLFITLDADTLLHSKAVRYIVSRVISAPQDIGAVAGSVLVRNSRDNLLARLQEWDYFLSIMSIKRIQGLFQGTLVAQGAFSIYKTELVREIGGWSDSIGELFNMKRVWR